MSGRQATLGKFFELPPGSKKPPPQQGKLDAAWKKQTKRADKGASGEAEEVPLGSVKEEKASSKVVPEVKTAAPAGDVVMANGEGSAEEKDTSETESDKGSAKGKQTELVDEEPISVPSRKKRRVMESDSEDDEDTPRNPKPRAKEKPPKKKGTSASKNAKSSDEAPDTSAEQNVKSEPETSRRDDASAKNANGAKGKAGDVSGKKVADRKKSGKQEVKEEEAASEESAEMSNEEREEEEAEEEEIDAEEEGKGHQKLAQIFQKPSEAMESKVKWKEGEPVPYAALAATFADIEATTKRLLILECLTTFLVKVIERSPRNLLEVVYLCINRLCPDYEGLELGIGESLLIKAIAQSTGREVARIKKDFESKGDLGLVALASRQKQPTMFKTAALTVPTVFKQLKEIASLTGNKSQDRKVGVIKKLLASCSGDEPKYLIRSLEGKLRIGLAERTVVVALAQSAVLSRIRQAKKKLSPEALSRELEIGANIVKAVFSELPSYDLVVPALLEDGVEGLRNHCKLTPGVPLKPMLAKPTKAIGEVLDRFEGKGFTCEYKYDGERAQVHLMPDGKLAVFSRNSENMSVKYPDLVEQVPRCIREGVTSFCLDAEATAWEKSVKNEETGEVTAGRLLPFQDLSRRKRKDVKAEDIKVKVKLFAFDLLYLNGEPLLHLDLAARRGLLHKHFQPVPEEFDFATSQDCTTVEEIQTLLDASVKEGCEGLMVKMLEGPDATYEPSRRSMNWLKLKKDYLSGTGDSLDLVVIGGYHGRGKRTNVYGAFLLACYDADNETYQSICKIGTGFTEQHLDAHFATLKPLEITQKKGYYDIGDAKPDVFFEPKVVWEVLTADLSLSPVYAAAKGLAGERGISLRFPRFIRIRDDKDAEDATGPEQVAEMYRAQVTSNKKSGGGAGADDDGFW